MDYYYCHFAQLWQETERRGYIPFGNHDELSEGLARDDETRGSHATTVMTVAKRFVAPRSTRQVAEYGQAIDPSKLVGERITHWKMNTFFPTLQLFFESGLSCTIEGGQLRQASVGIDCDLRFRLTDLTHEEDGVMMTSPLPEKFVGSIRILECVVADRISISTKSVASIGKYQRAKIEHEAHVAVGLKLEGMSAMGYVWAKADNPFGDSRSRTWGNTSVGGLRDDVPAPFFDCFQGNTKTGGQISVVQKASMISHGQRHREAFEKNGSLPLHGFLNRGCSQD